MSRKQIVVSDNKIYNMVFLRQYHRVPLFLFYRCVPQSSSNTQQTVTQLRIQFDFLTGLLLSVWTDFVRLSSVSLFCRHYNSSLKLCLCAHFKISISAECISSTLIGPGFSETSTLALPSFRLRHSRSRLER